MSMNWNPVLKSIKFLFTLFRPSLAKAISVPLLMAGIGILNPPLWLEILNWILKSQKTLPQYGEAISTLMYITGWILIGLSICIYLIDVVTQVKLMRQGSEKNLLEAVKDHPKQTADLIVDKIRSAGFTAPHLQDKEIEKLADEITLLRFFGSFPRKEKSISLAESIINGELSGGTPQVKARALALLARYLCIGESAAYAKDCLSISIKLCKTDEAEIAKAFINAIESSSVDAASDLLTFRTPSSYAAFFAIKKIVEGNKSALGWLENSGLSSHDLDDDGKVALVSALLSEKQWEDALNIARVTDDESLSMSPALSQLSAFAFLANAIKAIELREFVMSSVPLAAESFPLSDDSESIAFRNYAVKLFKVCSGQARNLGAEDVANMADNYVLWLEIRNSETHLQAKAQLQNYFVNYTQKTLEYLPLAFSFGINIDFESIEKEVNRQTALSHENNPILGLARFVLAQTKKPISAVVEYIVRHRDQIERVVNPIAVGMLEIEALARSGLVDDAELLLHKIEASGAPDAEVRNLQNIIESAKGKDPIALAISQFQQSKATNDLAHLVNLLERENLGDRYYSYCRALFERTGQESDAIRVCNAASSLGKFSELHQFLLERMDIVKRSEGLQAHWAWVLFRTGDLDGAKNQASLLKQCKSQLPGLKALEINLSIYSGDWESLSIFVEDSWSRRETLEADDLLQTAQLAKAVSPGRAKQILEFCTSKYSSDPKVLASAYLTATRMGYEDNQETSEWLNKAILLSEDDGPLHRASLEDLKEMMSEAREKNEKVYRAYFDGDAPVFTVAELLNRTMSDFYLIQPLENISAKDIRRKDLVPIFHSARLGQIIVGDKIAIDSSSALVMENIGLLPLLFNCFGRIVIPHSFLRCLFEEKQKVSFHQPSQIEKAKYFERLVFDGRVSIFHPKKISNPELALDVGDDLAFMLEEAHSNTEAKSQSLVVCSFPVYKVGGSFREVEADLSSFEHCLISCAQLIRKLEAMAVITEAQCLKALGYLRQHEREWPANLEIVSGARLFLDSLSVTYLMTVNMLDKLSEGGFDVYVLNRERDRYRSLTHFDLIINQADAKIENIRKLFSSGLASGKVVIAEMPLNSERVIASKHNYARSTEEIFETVKVCDAALIDDRFMNRHQTITFGEITVPIFTSLDFIETLHEKRLISKEQKLDARAALRELGFEFVSVSPEELEYHLNQSTMIDGGFKPTRQLRLIRESLLLIRISGLIQLPRDAHWLQQTLKTIVAVIMNQWSLDISLELLRARSCWLYELIGYREWAQTHRIRSDEGMAYWGSVLKVNSLLMTPESLSAERKEDYKMWLDEFVLAPMRDLDPLSFKLVVNSIKDQVRSISLKSILEE